MRRHPPVAPLLATEHFTTFSFELPGSSARYEWVLHLKHPFECEAD